MNTITRKIRTKSKGWGFALYYFEKGLSLLFWKWFIPLPIKPWRELRDVCESWGVKYSSYENALMFYWGTVPDKHYPSQGRSRYKLFWMPWDWGSCVEHDVLNEAGQFVPEKRNEKYEAADGRKTESFPYVYNNGGEIQNVTATVYVDRMEWRWRITHRLPFKIGPKKVSTSICVSFSEAIGAGVHTWKGGTTGCGYEMLPGETALQTLRRMERERVFR